MFKKTAAKISELTDTKHEVDVNVTVDIDPITKSLIRTALIVAGLNVAVHAINALVENNSKTSKSDDQ